MGKHDKLKSRIASGTSNANIDFDALCSMLAHEGFTMKTTASSHQIFTRPDVPAIINLQPGGDGKAKPYQVRQVAVILEKYKTK